MVADIEELEKMDASEIHASKLSAKEVLTPTSGEQIFSRSQSAATPANPLWGGVASRRHAALRIAASWFPCFSPFGRATPFVGDTVAGRVVLHRTKSGSRRQKRS